MHNHLLLPFNIHSLYFDVIHIYRRVLCVCMTFYLLGALNHKRKTYKSKVFLDICQHLKFIPNIFFVCKQFKYIFQMCEQRSNYKCATHKILRKLLLAKQKVKKTKRIRVVALLLLLLHLISLEILLSWI